MKEAEDFGFRTCVARLGVALKKNGEVPKEILPALKRYFGGIIDFGRRWFSCVHIDDVYKCIWISN